MDTFISACEGIVAILIVAYPLYKLIKKDKKAEENETIIPPDVDDIDNLRERVRERIRQIQRENGGDE